MTSIGANGQSGRIVKLNTVTGTVTINVAMAACHRQTPMIPESTCESCNGAILFGEMRRF
jgi:hypothetical protein